MIIKIRPFQQRQNIEISVSNALEHLIQELDKVRREEIRHLYQIASDPQRFRAITESIATLADISNEITQRKKKALKLRPEEAVSLLEDLYRKVEQLIVGHVRDYQAALARRILVHAIDELCSTERRIVEIFKLPEDLNQEEKESTSSVPLRNGDPETPLEESSPEESHTIRSVHLSSALLYHAHRSLFPPERMLVVAGHREASTICLDATWDVTGSGPDTHAGHVRANAGKLGRALIDMELSGTELGAWIHSHPGTGIAATTPSSIDHRQHQDWIQNYSPALLSIIMVANGYIRFWGSALESGQIETHIDGQGIIQEEHHVYRLAQ